MNPLEEEQGVKKLIVVLGVAGFMLFAAGSASADGATVIDEFGCTLLASDSGLGANLFTDDTHAVITPSGNTLLSCSFDIPDGLEPGRAIKNSGFTCGTFLGVSNDSMVVSSPGGNAHLTCHINGSS
jgi:hypothetical protein